jgi:hypothetical protein
MVVQVGTPDFYGFLYPGAGGNTGTGEPIATATILTRVDIEVGHGPGLGLTLPVVPALPGRLLRFPFGPGQRVLHLAVLGALDGVIGSVVGEGTRRLAWTASGVAFPPVR